MRPKKTKRASLEGKKKLFFEIGLLLALIVAYSVIEVRSYDANPSDLGIFGESGEDQNIIEEEIPITERQKHLPPPPPPSAIPYTQDVLDVVDDNTILAEELQIGTSEIDPDEESFPTTEYVEGGVGTGVSIGEVIEEEESDEIIPFSAVESKPVFPGCESLQNDKQALRTCFEQKVLGHIKKKFRYPAVAKEMGVQGRVFVYFVVNKKGSIEDIKILRKIDKSLEEEALRIVRTLPKMKPAHQRNKPVRTSFVVPIVFALAK